MSNEKDTQSNVLQSQQSQQTQQSKRLGQSKQSKPSITRVNFVNIPQILKSTCSFCLWRKEKRNGKPTKVPYDPKTGQMAKTDDPSTFSDFATAMKAYALGIGKKGWDGIGFRVSEGIGAIDIDHCFREDGSLNDVAANILSLLHCSQTHILNAARAAGDFAAFLGLTRISRMTSQHITSITANTALKSTYLV